MPNYPVDDNKDVLDAVNDLLSGPGGLGQNFQGVSSSDPAFVRPTFRGPFLLPIDTTFNPSWYLDIPINNAVGVDADTFQVTFSTAQSSAPFQFGDRLRVQNVTDDAGGTPFNGFPWYVLDSTTTTANLYFPGGSYLPWANYVSGGNLVRDFNNQPVSADNNARVTIFGPTDQAFITSQIRLEVDIITAGNADVRIENTVERYRGYPIEGTQDYTFALDDIISKQSEDFAVTGNVTLPVEAIFTTVLDDPGFGYYWYFNNFYVLPLGGLVPSQTNINLPDYYAQYSVQGVSPIATSNTYANTLPVITVTGTGSGGVLDFYIYTTGSDVINTDTNDTANLNLEVYVATAGSGYAVGDIIKILGNNLPGGSTPDNDVVLKLNAVENANSTYAGNVVVGLRSFTAQVIKQ